MSQQPHISGLAIGFENPVTGYTKIYTSIAGVPDGTGALADYAIGSEVTNELTGFVYVKRTNNGNAADWIKLATQTDVEAIASGRSWREPVLVADFLATTLPTGANIIIGTTNPVSFAANGTRVLFANPTGSFNPNVYIYDAVGEVFVEDTNLATNGDTVFVEDGDFAGKEFTYNNTESAGAPGWFLTSQTSLNELGYLRAYVGKTAAGSELPQYTNNNYVADNDTLVAAIDKLDAGLGNARHEFSASAVTTATTVDSVLVDDVRRAIWEVDVAKADESAFKTVMVNAIHNGKTSADASSVDFATDDILKIGTIVGLQFNVTLAGSGGAQTMGLTVVSTPSVNVKGIRRVIAV